LDGDMVPAWKYELTVTAIHTYATKEIRIAVENIILSDDLCASGTGWASDGMEWWNT
jgi:hypothetical protein